ncbi:MAG: hemolysin family protein [Phycisphaerae bacterium]
MPIWIAVAATILSGFFGLTGFALRAFRRARLEEVLSGKSGKARLVLLDRHLPALQLTASFGRAVASLVLVVAILYIFEPAHASGGWGLWAVYATLIAGTIVAVFSVGIPHAWAFHAAEGVLAATIVPMLVFRYLFYPFVALMQAMDLPIRRLAGVVEEVEEADKAREEILQAASEGKAEGAVGAEEVRMIESVIEFGQMKAGEIMTPRTDIFALPIELPWQEAAARIVEAGHSRVPVYEGDIDNILGIVYAKDLLGLVSKGEPNDLRRIMRKPYFVPESKTLADLLREFKTRRVHLSIVLDEYGGTAGLVSIEDIVEEIVGEIADEYDVAGPALMTRLDERTAEVDGRIYIDDLNEAMGLDIPEDEDYDTIAGMIFAELGYIPPRGEKLEAYGARFTVTAADERKITKVRVELLDAQPEEK